MERPVLLCGLGRIGGRILDHLRAAGLPVTVVTLDPPPESPPGVRVLKGDCRRPEVLEQAGLATARGVIIVTSDDLVNVSTALLVRRLNPDVRVVVRMFNQNLIPRLGAAVRNVTGLSVSALVAPMLALAAVTGDALGTFTLDDRPQQIADVPIPDDSPLVGRRLSDIASSYKLLVLAHAPAGQEPVLWNAVRGDTRLAAGDRVFGCGGPDDLARLTGGAGPDGVRWATWVRRQARTAGRTLSAIDAPVRWATVALFVTLFASTLVFRFGIGHPWADSFFQTVRVAATGADLSDKGLSDEGKLFVGGLKIVGAALLAGFTAVFTQYLIRAKLGGAFEGRKVPDGGHVVVCGLGNIGFRCVEELVRMGRRAVAVEQVNDNAFAATVRRMGVPVIVGDATVDAVLRQAKADTARAVLACTESELANLEIALLVRELNPTQRVVVRLTEPAFAEAARAAADIRLAVSVPALAAPAFAAALFGDRVRTLLTVGGRTLAVVELVVQPGDACFHEVSLVAAMVDYRFLPVGLGGRPPFAAEGLPKTVRLKEGDRLTVVVPVPDLERLLRREPAAADRQVIVEAFPLPAKEVLVPLVRTVRGCTQAEAEAAVIGRFVLAERLTQGAAEELVAQVGREKVQARVE